MSEVKPPPDHVMSVWAEVESVVNGALNRDELPPDHMHAIAAKLRRLADSLDTMAKPPTCTHGVTFDHKATRTTECRSAPPVPAPEW